MSCEELGNLIERGRALGALDVESDTGGLEERRDFTGHTIGRFE
jgi:hypothetical protein